MMTIWKADNINKVYGSPFEYFQTTRWTSNKPDLKHNSESHYPHKKVVPCDSLKYVEFIWLSSIEFIKDLQFWKNILCFII